MYEMNDLFTEEHCWIRMKAGHIYLGLTSFILQQLEAIELIEAQKSCVDTGDVLFVIETRKTCMEFHAPFPVMIDSINPQLLNHYSIIHQDPYQSGWLFTLDHAEFIDKRKYSLMNAKQYKSYIKEI